jgi:hypothetical protein
MTCEKTLTRVIDFLFESSLSPAKNAKRIESDSDESLTRPNTTEKPEIVKKWNWSNSNWNGIGLKTTNEEWGPKKEGDL